MAFNGKATFDGGSTLPELAEDLAPSVDILAHDIVPFLDRVGMGGTAKTTHLEWMEDAMLPNKDTVPSSATADQVSFSVVAPTYFRVGDIVQVRASDERMMVISTTATKISTTRGYGSSTKEAISAAAIIEIIGNAQLEGADAVAARFRNKERQENWTQIFQETVEVSGSMEAAAKAAGHASEFEYQREMRLRELLVQLERAVLRGTKAASTAYGSATVRRTMQGLSRHIEAHSTAINRNASSAVLTEDLLNEWLRSIWELGGRPDLVVCGSLQKRRISSLLQPYTTYSPGEKAIQRTIQYYDCDFGRVEFLLSPHPTTDSLLAFETKRVEVLQMAGRSFHLVDLARTGDSRRGMIVGEYSCRLKSPAAHGRLYNLSVA